MSASVADCGAYKEVDVATASQGKLIVMLFNGAIQRAEEAKRQLEKSQREGAHNNLIRAQEIIAELRGALNMGAGAIAGNLDRVYEYFQHLLIRANVAKDVQPINECVSMMTSVRDTWQELFDALAKEEKPTKRPPEVNQHGSAIINVQG
ncbi:MAG TPA: flagellar export chaperone FliS [Candidatus Hydrogenedentes bacterium]|nr:flagellar export chaperone FliS [Candidatus Hydrogenedentota bacterium]